MEYEQPTQLLKFAMEILLTPRLENPTQANKLIYKMNRRNNQREKLHIEAALKNNKMNQERAVKNQYTNKKVYKLVCFKKKVSTINLDNP